ncbi:MAG TPA: tripartite tricarboxylate transporter TctB family protein [Geminicoccaceae bacterium]|nr:tripartite tricarboxylate transporter TctB family protein [Geminicoccus sp.]HMU51666.1 tripartite tricarboxylate transporter TctB family protein [Geminicoccaceae bacterium]
MRIDDRITAVVLGLLAVIVVWSARAIPAVPGTTFGPELFPTLIGLGLGGAAIAIFIEGVRTAGGPLLDLSDWHGRRKGIAAASWAIAGTVVGILFFERLGFPLYGFAFTVPLMLLMGARPVVAVPVAALVVLGTHLFFTRALFVPLPAGPLAFLG